MGMLKEGSKQAGDSTGVTGPVMDVSMDIVASKAEHPTEGVQGRQVMKEHSLAGVIGLSSR